MLKRFTLAALVAVFASVTTVSAAHKPPSHKKIIPPGPTITTTPRAPKVAHVNTIYTFTGTKFPAKSAVPVKLLCPAWGATQYGAWAWTAHADAKGNFTQKRKVPPLQKVKHAMCNIYAEALTKQSAYWVSIGFVISR